jgi:hypothetical protein
MPYQSEAQRRAFYYLESQGKLPKGTAGKWQAETPKNKPLPERKKKKKK